MYPKFIVQLAEKYNDDIFYVSPFYWTIFPKIDRLIVVDADVQVNPKQVF